MENEDSKPDIENLKRFSSRILTKDRGKSPFFSGRSQEIDDVELSIEGVMERLRDGRPRPAADETWLFQGSPGAGKSALLERLEEKWSTQANERTPFALPVRADLIFSQANLVAKIADAVVMANSKDTKAETELRQAVSTDRGSATDIGGEFIIKASTRISEAKSIFTNPRESTWETLARVFPPEHWSRPIVLLLDEAQSLHHWEGPSEISNLHQGNHGLPIIPIYAGLSDTFEALRKHGITRMAQRRRVTLGALKQSEAEAAVLLMLDAFRVEGDDHDGWARKVARDCCGWPQHLQTGLQALAKAVVDNDGMLGPIEGAIADSVFEMSEKYRNDYYEERLDDDLACSIGLMHIALDAARPPGKTLAELKCIVANSAHDNQEYKYQLPEKMDTPNFLNRMIKRGFLQQTKPGRRFICPIPSMTDYIGKLAIE